MDEKSEEEASQLLKVLGLAGTWDILHFLFENGPRTYLDFRQSINTHTLNMRLNALIETFSFWVSQERFWTGEGRFWVSSGCIRARERCFWTGERR